LGAVVGESTTKEVHVFHTQPKTYKKVSLLHKNYFDLLCGSNGYSREEYDICEKEDNLGFPVYTVDVWSQRCDDMMQRVFSEANGYKR